MQRLLTKEYFYDGYAFQGEIWKNNVGLIEDVIILVNGQPVEFLDHITTQQTERMLQIIMQDHQGELPR